MTQHDRVFQVHLPTQEIEILSSSGRKRYSFAAHCHENYIYAIGGYDNDTGNWTKVDWC